MANPIVKEGSLAYITVSFKDKDGNLASPASATWQVHDDETGNILQAETNILPISSQVELLMTSTINTLISGNHAEETRVLTIKATTAGGNVNDEYKYDVIGLNYLP